MARSSAAVIGKRLWLIIWKNLLFRRRHYCVTAMEIILPTILIGCLAFIYAITLGYINREAKLQAQENGVRQRPRSYDPSVYSNGNNNSRAYSNDDDDRDSSTRATIFGPRTEEQLIQLFNRKFSNYPCSGGVYSDSDCIVAFAPENQLTNEFMKNLQLGVAVNGYASDEKIQDALERSEFEQIDKTKASQKPIFAVIFHNGLKDLSGKVAYTIRMRSRSDYYYGDSGSDIQTDTIFPRYPKPGPGLYGRTYAEEGVLGLQILLDKALIKLMADEAVDHSISLQAFPYPPYAAPKDFRFVLNLFTKFFPAFLVISFIFMVPAIMRGIVNEKQSGIKELMKMMGLPNWMHWFGWLFNSMIVIIISITIVTFLLFVPFDSDAGAFFKKSSSSLFWIMMLLYTLASTCFCFFLSSFFSKPMIGISFGLVIWLVSYFAVYNTMEATFHTLTVHHKLASAVFLPNMGLYWALQLVVQFELNGGGATWDTLCNSYSTVDELSLCLIFLMFIISSVLYILLTLYLECVLPSQYGIRRPWYFLFRTYACSRKVTPSSSQWTPEETDANKPEFEKEPPGLVAGVEIKNLTKSFGKNKIAVKGLTMKMYNGEIMALLGHNGAGKTTTMSMLTGMFSPTSGTAVINGHDIVTDMAGVRENLGLCPQHNMLFDTLTVAEHLEFFGRLKGLSAIDAKRQGDDFLYRLKLGEKRNVSASKLSGGQKRRLSLANALIGGSKIVMLDEPTSGLDPEARREVWDLLLAMRGERTIIITTHFMEEADVLGDRIAIMADGKLQCSGTSMYLKRFYGTGYTLNLTVTEGANRDIILEKVQVYVPKASFKAIQSANDAEMAITLPTESAETSVFPELFGTLMNEKESLGVETIGLSLTTMDEVFVRVGEISEGDHGDNKNENQVVHENNESSIKPRLITGPLLWLQQFWALIIKRFLYTLRNRKLFIFQLILPVVCLIIAILVCNLILAPEAPFSPLTISSKLFKKQITLYTSSPEEADLGQSFKKVVGDSGKLYEKEGKTIIDGLLEASLNDLGSYREKYMIAAEIKPSVLKGLYSSLPPHSAPLVVNTISNALLKKLAPLSSKQSIEITIHPMKSTIEKELRYGGRGIDVVGPIVFSVFVPLGLALLAATYIVFPVEERLCKAKHLQTMSGINPLIYWGASLLWDFLLILIIICAMLACFPIFETYQLFTAYDGLGVMFLVLATFGLTAIIFSYWFSTFVGTVSGGFALVTIIHVLSGMMLSFIVHLLDTAAAAARSFGRPIEKLETAAITLKYLFRLLPTFGVATAVLKFTDMAVGNIRCNKISANAKKIVCNNKYIIDGGDQYRLCCDDCTGFGEPCFQPQEYITWTYSTEYGEFSGLSEELLCLFLVGVIYLVIFLLVEFQIFHILGARMNKTNKFAFGELPQDEDVRAEDQRVYNQIHGQDTQIVPEGGRYAVDDLLVERLSKSYGSFAAVSNLSFGVHHGECFGLLGVNGAGKTTTFRMLTGDEYLSNGNAFAVRYSLQKSPKNFHKSFGYCPQFDGIVNVLSGKEMLQLFARLRGIRYGEVNRQADSWLEKLGLTGSRNVQCGKYSGGMKRRLSAGMALIGDPSIILLDEPTSGVDPISRRQFWKILTSVKNSGQAIVLTSHSMDECEFLCSRLGIMVNGQLQCLGGVQHLKAKFAQGYSTTIKLKPMIPPESPELKALTTEIETRLYPCFLKDSHQNVLQYQLLNTTLQWDVIFKTMEEIKAQFEALIEEYSVSETTLEEVFLAFARQQYAQRTAYVSGCEKLTSSECCQ